MLSVASVRVTRGRSFLLIALTVLLVLASGAAFHQVRAQNGPTILHVDGTSTAGGDGLSWENAFTDIQVALSASDSITDPVEIWVAAGTYVPGNDRDDHFELRDNVAIYGGFAGTETERDARDWFAHPTILSGDIGVSGDVADNSYTVVYGNGVGDTAVLNGFTVANGNANGSSGFPVTPSGHGGGIYLTGSSPLLSNLEITDNYASNSGGGLSSLGNSSPTITDSFIHNNETSAGGGGLAIVALGDTPVVINNTHITDNQAAIHSGGLYFEQGTLEITDSSITNNSQQGTVPAEERGGGMFLRVPDEATLTNVTISGNQTEGAGGGLALLGGPVTLTNVAIFGNQSASGGGLHTYSGSQMTLEMTNTTISGNRAADGGGLRATASVVEIANSIILGNSDESGNAADIVLEASTVTLSHSMLSDDNCDTDDAVTCTNMVAGPPDFVDPVPASSAPTSAGDYHLQTGSPGIDQGDNNAVPSGITTDLDGNVRIANSVVDLGPYEIQVADVPTLTLTVDDDTPEVGTDVTVSVSLSATNASPDYFEGETVVLSGHNGDVDLVLDENSEASTVISSQVAGPMTLTATYGDISQQTDITWSAGPADSIVLTVEPDTQTTGQPVTVEAVVHDEFGNPVADGTPVSFEVDRDGTASVVGGNSWTVETEAGTASIDYTNSEAGTDVVTASAGDASESGPANVEWADEGGDDPETKQDCKTGGWQDHGFTNQGQCIKFVNTGKDSR